MVLTDVDLNKYNNGRFKTCVACGEDREIDSMGHDDEGWICLNCMPNSDKFVCHKCAEMGDIEDSIKHDDGELYCTNCITTV